MRKKRNLLCLLSAEEEKELSNALCAILKYNNRSMDAVYDGINALKYGLSGNYDAILGIMMPGMSGPAPLRELKKWGSLLKPCFL